MREKAKSLVAQASIFRSLDEKYFESPEALVFAQINAELPYVDASFLNYKFSALINCDKLKRVKGFVEHALWYQT